MEAEAGDPRVRFTPSSLARAGPGHSRDEVSVYGNPKEEILPHVNNINSSRHDIYTLYRTLYIYTPYF